jgi:SagB-type dehydrogenase family enzyme
MRNRLRPLTAVLILFLLIIIGCTDMSRTSPATAPAPKPGPIITLPAPRLDGPMSVDQSLHERRSVRTYQDSPLTQDELSQLLWAAQGITHPSGWRTAASAGGLYPLELLAAIGQVEGLAAGIYRYRPDDHSLIQIQTGDQRAALSAAALGQESVAQGAVVLALAGVYERSSGRYGQRAAQYVHMEVGIAYQNVHLQAVSLGLGTVFIGAFDDEQVQSILGLADEERPFCLMPLGKPKHHP